MKQIRLLVGVFFFVGLFTSTSLAQTGANGRTFVSGQGSDSNTCSVTAPCRTFARALTQTAAGGEVVVLGSAGYGPFAISHSVTIEAPAGIYAGITVATGAAIDISVASTDVVILRGLTIVGEGSTGVGIDASILGTLHVENCVIDGFSGGDSMLTGIGLGVFGFGRVLVKDSIFRDNVTGIGITSGSAVTLDHVRMEGNSTGLSAAGGPQVSVNDSDASGNETGIFADTGSTVNLIRCVASNNNVGIQAQQTQSTNAQTFVIVEGCLVSSNVNDGVIIQSSHGVVQVTVSDTAITGNSVGVVNASGNETSGIFSYGNNRIFTNVTNGAFTGTPIKLQ